MVKKKKQAAPPKKAASTKFVCARYPGLKVVVIPSNTVMKEGGVVVPVKGKTATFERGLLVTNDKDIIERLRSHMWFGVHITEITQADADKIIQRAKIDKKAREIAEKMIADEESGKTVTAKTADILAGKGKTTVTGGTKGTK